MRRHLIGLGIVTAAALVVFGCGGSSTTSQMGTGSPGTGQLALMATDAPICGVISFDATITNAALTPQGGGSTVSVISSSDSVTADFASLMGFNTLLNLSSVPAGTYSQISFTFMPHPQLTVLDGTPPTPTTINTTLTQTTVTANINPALHVGVNSSAGLTLDFQLFKSIQTDVTGQITGAVDPSIHVVPAVISTVNGLGHIDDLPGIVRTVTPTSSNSNFTGSFTLRVRNNRTFLINVTRKTEFENIAGLSGLTEGTFVEVDAKVDQDGNIIANEVESESQTDVTRAAFRGPILSVTRDTNGNARQLTMFVRAEYPDVSSTVPLRSVVTVNISSQAVFRVATLGADLSAFLFSPSAIGRGQHVTVHGPFTGGTPAVITGKQIVLRPQPVLGNYLSTLAVGPDGKTGGYALAPCNPLFQNQTVSVLTFSNTVFDGLTDLGSLNTTSEYLNRGFLLYATTSGTVNGVSWNPPPPAYIFLGFLLRQLDLP